MFALYAFFRSSELKLSSPPLVVERLALEEKDFLILDRRMTRFLIKTNDELPAIHRKAEFEPVSHGLPVG